MCCATGTLDLKGVLEILLPYCSDKVTALTLTDPQGRVIACSAPERAPMQVWNRKETGIFQPLDERMYLWRSDNRNLPSMTRWKQSFYVQETMMGPELPWKLTAEAPVAPLQHILYAIYVKNLTIMACLTALALLLSQMFSRGLTRPLAKLAQVTVNLPEKLPGAENIDWPSSSTHEVDLLIGNFESMAKALDVNFLEVRVQGDELRQANLELRLQIQERLRIQDDLRNSDEKFRSLVETTSDWVWEVDRNGCYTYVSPKIKDLLGYTPEEVIGKKPFDFMPREEAERSAVFFRQIGARHEPFSNMVNANLHKDGRLVVLETSGIPIFDTMGNPRGYRGIDRDVTERNRAEAERRRLEERLLRAEKMEALGTLAGGVAHDLNNVLGIVVGYSELLLGEADGSSAKRSYVMNILNGGERAAAIVQDLLTLARRGVPTRNILNLNDFVTECRNSPDFLKLLSYHDNVEIRTDLEADLLNMSGSSVHLTKSLMNLISNAAEAMPAGGVLGIRTGNRYLDKPVSDYDEIKAGDYVVLSVSDTGEGIPAADLKRIFEPFYTKKVMGRSGTGLGLAVVWGTVKDHQGYIDVESEEGKGSTFTLYFPVSREEISPVQISVSASEYMGNGESILVVDDMKEQRELATTMLTKLNYIVTSVSSGEEAVAYVKTHAVDLIVLDMIMDPGMDGLDTYLKLLETHPHQKVIIVSGFAETERVSKAQLLGAGAYVKKPYVLEKLGLAVKKELS
jgi:PAS domain S-box-containing protein